MLPVSRLRFGVEDGKSPRVQRPSWLSTQYSVRYEREVVAPPPTLETYTPTAGLVASLKLETPHVSTIYGRVGCGARARSLPVPATPFACPGCAISLEMGKGWGSGSAGSRGRRLAAKRNLFWPLLVRLCA